MVSSEEHVHVQEVQLGGPPLDCKLQQGRGLALSAPDLHKLLNLY